MSLDQGGAATSYPAAAATSGQLRANVPTTPVRSESFGGGPRPSHFESESLPSTIRYVSPPRRSHARLVVVIGVACVLVAIILILAILPLGTLTHPGSTSGFSQQGHLTSVGGYNLYFANLTFSATKGAAVAMNWTTNASESLCAVGVAGPAAGTGYGPTEGSGFCVGSYSFTSNGGNFYLIVDGVVAFTVSGSITLGPTTTKAPIL